MNGIVEHLKVSAPVEGVGAVSYPREMVRLDREESLRLGVPVEEEVWAKVVELADIR